MVDCTRKTPLVRHAQKYTYLLVVLIIFVEIADNHTRYKLYM